MPRDGNEPNTVLRSSEVIDRKAPQEFIRILKLERAAELLKQKTPVTEVAVMTGFANSKYFSTIFKKHFGVSPSKFCEQN